MQEMMALYALGALPQDEAWALENCLAENDNSLAEELEVFETVAAHLALAAPEQTPPLKLRQNLLALVAEETKPSAKETFTSSPRNLPFFSLRAEESQWQEIAPGMLTRTLFVDHERGMVTSLVRMLPGAALPPHKHLGIEQFYVLEGDCIVEGTHLGPGDFHSAAAGSVHESTYTVEGTTFLLIAPANYEILQPVH
jgi:anti-sigma factor ChrR (cupin superfamily)